MQENTGHKLMPHQENPIDLLISKIASPLADYLIGLGFTPNHVTFFSFTFGVLSIVGFWRRHMFLAMLCYLIGYVFDCTDGVMARRYHMESVFGDIFDHFTDVIVWLLLITLILTRVKQYQMTFIWPLIIELVLLATNYYQLACQEKLVASQYIPIYGVNGEVCKNVEWLKWTRFGGTGTLTVWHLFLIWFYSRYC